MVQSRDTELAAHQNKLIFEPIFAQARLFTLRVCVLILSISIHQHHQAASPRVTPAFNCSGQQKKRYINNVSLLFLPTVLKEFIANCLEPGNLEKEKRRAGRATGGESGAAHNLKPEAKASCILQRSQLTSF